MGLEKGTIGPLLRLQRGRKEKLRLSVYVSVLVSEEAAQGRVHKAKLLKRECCSERKLTPAIGSAATEKPPCGENREGGGATKIKHDKQKEREKETSSSALPASHQHSQ